MAIKGRWREEEMMAAYIVTTDLDVVADDRDHCEILSLYR